MKIHTGNPKLDLFLAIGELAFITICIIISVIIEKKRANSNRNEKEK
jgi:hypothetical protein